MTTINQERIRVHIRWMIRRDLPEVLLIEAAGAHPWTEEDFLRWLRQRNCIGMVAEVSNQVVGFMIYELWKKKISILNFAVHPEYRRRGIGSRMLSRMASKLAIHRRTHLVVDVRETNLEAQLFFQRHGFLATNVLRSSFEDSGEDAYRMMYWLLGAMSSSEDEIPVGES